MTLPDRINTEGRLFKALSEFLEDSYDTEKELLASVLEQWKGSRNGLEHDLQPDMPLLRAALISALVEWTWDRLPNLEKSEHFIELPYSDVYDTAHQQRQPVHCSMVDDLVQAICVIYGREGNDKLDELYIDIRRAAEKITAGKSVEWATKMGISARLPRPVRARKGVAS